MYYITKHLYGKPRRYLYEAYRDEKTGKPKRRLVAYLGKFQTVGERLDYLRTELIKAKRRESELWRILEPSLCELRRLDKCPTWEEMLTMGLRERRISFFLPGSFEASKEIGSLKSKMLKMEDDIDWLRWLLPRLVIAPK